MSIKVLVADDSITIQKVIGIIFGGDEYSLTVVDNGKSAVEKAREITPDILLIDALMPGMNGYEVSEAIRATPALATKPILILTGSFEPFDEDKAKKCGADDFIAKPFESQQIITKVKELLELGSSRSQSAAGHALQPSAQETATVPAFEIDPVSIPNTEALQESQQQMVEKPSADIWGAFTAPEEPVAPVVKTATPTEQAPIEMASFEPDVFAIVTEENDAQLVQTSTSSPVSPQHTGSQWIPVEENTFEFEEVPAAAPAPVAAVEPEVAFGDISFESEYITPAIPVPASIPEAEYSAFAAPAEPFVQPSALPEPFAPLADPEPFISAPEVVAPVVVPVAVAPTTTSVTLTEDQLKTALAAASKDVIERIVWEVVPDLAEALIKDAIRKIKEGL